MINTLDENIITKIFLYLSNNDRIALLAVYPRLQVNWSIIYNQKNSSIQRELYQIHKKFFPYSKKDRICAMEKIYNHYDPQNHSFIDYENDDLFWKNYRKIPIIDIYVPKIEDYIYSIEDYIYEDIYNLKANILSGNYN